VAQSKHDDEVLRIWNAEAIDEQSSQPPGSVLSGNKSGIDVACGEGVLRITRLQRPGGKPQSAADFLNAHRLDGVVLGG